VHCVKLKGQQYGRHAIKWRMSVVVILSIVINVNTVT